MGDTMKGHVRIAIATTLLALSALTSVAAPVSGRPVASMAVFDQLMSDFMATNAIEAGVLGIMRNNRIVYLRGFGYLDTTVDNPNLSSNTPLPENALFRQASLSKPPTAAAVRRLAEQGALGTSGIERVAFRLTVGGADNNGMLNIPPWQSLGTTNWAHVKIRHLLDHTSGYVGAEPHRQIAVDMGLQAPPKRADVISYVMDGPLAQPPHDWSPTNWSYQNFNYVALAEVVASNYAGVYIQGMRDLVMTPEVWIPASDILQSATVRAQCDRREPWYRTGCTGQSVNDYTAPIDIVSCAYGGNFDMEAFAGAASLVASAPTMLTFGSLYHLWYPNAGVPITPGYPADGAVHDGGLAGISTRLQARGDGIVIYLAFNGAAPLATIFGQVSTVIDTGLGTQYTWPNTTSDGFWVTLGSENPTNGFGGYHSEWQGFGSAVARASDGSRLRLKPGASPWTGTLTKRMRLDAPEGVVSIGD